MFNPNKAGLFEDNFFYGVGGGKGGGGQFDLLSYFKKNFSNISITLQLLNNLFKVCCKLKKSGHYSL